MRYIFLDTESSNCFNSVYKICEYGYVTADKDLNLIKGGKKDVLINPGNDRDSRFHLKGRKGGRDLILAHDEKEYKNHPTFDAMGDNLRFFLTQKDIKIFLWAGENDIQAIIDNCYRYGFSPISFVSYDVQILYRNIMKPEKIPSLEKAMEELGIHNENIVAHRPDEDSLMTLLILKALSEKTGKTVEALLNECPKCKRDSIPFYGELIKKRNRKKQKPSANNKA